MDFLRQIAHTLSQAAIQRLRQWTKPDNHTLVLNTALIGTLLACTFENLYAEQNPQLVAACNAVIRFVRKEIPWVYMYGPPGNGKTHLAAAAANHLVAQGKAVLFATAPELLAMVRQGFDDP
jgi:DNA replication protein DnaC